MTNRPSKPKAVLLTSKHDVMQEKLYVTKKIDTSIAILGSPEDDFVTEALVVIIKYVDVDDNNLHYVEQHGLLQKLLNLFGRSKCVLRLVLKLLEILLTLEQVVLELDQDIYDDKISEICNHYISNPDPHVKRYCLSVLRKLTESTRISYNISNFNLLEPIMNSLKSKTEQDQLLLQWTLELFLRLLEIAASSKTQEKICNFDIALVMKYLHNSDEKLLDLSLKIIERFTYLCFDVSEEKFKKAKLIENMLAIVMNQEKLNYHTIAFKIINICMSDEKTYDYFIETLEFLEFCQWAKTCEEQYHFPCILIIGQLTKIPNRRQILFDFSVEETILSFMRSTQKRVLNKTCEAICNMMTHRYCCEQMLTPDLMKDLFLILERKDDEEDPQNEVAIKTLLEFSRKNLSTLTMIHELGLLKELLNIFSEGDMLSDKCFAGILEMIYTMSIYPQYQQDIVRESFFERLIGLFQQAPPKTASFACQIMTNFVENYIFRGIFLSSNGPQIFIKTLQDCTDIHFLKIILLFIYKSLPHKDFIFLSIYFVRNLVNVLKKMSEVLKLQVPLIDKMLKLIYNSFPSLKFFETGRLEVTDVLRERFYLIEGLWKVPFPSLEDLEESPLSTLYSVYVVDYTTEFLGENSAASESVAPRMASSISTVSKVSSNSSSYFRRGLFEIRYGKLTTDAFLPRDTFRISKSIMQEDTVEKKVKTLAQHIHDMLSVPREGYASLDKIHNLMLHVEILKHKLGTNMIPLGFLRLGAHCQRALYFKAVADRTCIPTTLVKGKSGLYWNEIALISFTPQENLLTLYVVDLMENIGQLLLVGSRAANRYCNLRY